MNLSENILNLRKANGLTQEVLADKLGITFQAVSKWENEQSLPDITLLPQLADILGTSIDGLFGHSSILATSVIVPWNDNKLRGMIFRGNTLLQSCDDLSNFTFTYEGEALNIESNCNITCCNVDGNVSAGVDVNCNNVGGFVEAGVNVNCGDVKGYVNAGVSLDCGDVGDYANAGVSINCGNVGGKTNAGA